MTITLDIPPQLEAQLREGIARGDAAAVQRLLADAFALTVAAMLNAAPPLSDAEFEALADQLADEWEADGGPKDIVPADRILTREDIYEDHP
jgi:antitoxin ParD1/3/4